jgi:phosphate transport system protein
MKEMRKHFHDAIAEMDRDVLTMGAHVEESVRRATQALIDQDVELADLVVSQDGVINELEIKIEDKLTILIATEQPVAGDLRHIITSLKIISQLERMGDHSVHIAQAVKRLAGQKYLKALVDLPKMADIGITMLHEVLNAFADGDREQAVKIAAMDDKIDELHNQVWRELLSYMMQDVKNINQATSLLFVSRWLERFGDHATNISEWIVYDCSGEHMELNR